MSSSSRVKTLGFLVLAVVAVASIGSYAIWNKPVGQNTASLSSTSILQTTAPGTGVQTTSTTAVSLSPVQWITVGKVQQVNYYLTLLESNGTQPYVRLGMELRRLPDLSNTTAVAKIAYLALNATNPEIKEAFELMMKGGTPDPRDFQYTVPRYNTELQVLYWLALQNEFKKDDTLALAVAMANGLWVTIGDESVKKDVNTDTTQLLAFLRGTNEIQLSTGRPPLEDYPLEAKVSLAYTSSIGTIDGPHSLWKFAGKHVSLGDYRWVRYDVPTLEKMSEIAVEKGWVEHSVDLTVQNLEEYFYFSGAKEHWMYSTTTGDVPGVTESLIQVNGELVPDHGIYDLGFYLNLFLSARKERGDCGDETYLMEAWSKSLGIASTYALHQIIVNGSYYGHVHMLYYEPTTKAWKAYDEQLADNMYWNKSDLLFYVFIFRPPVRLTGYLAFSPIEDTRMGKSGTIFVVQYTPVEFRSVFLTGLPTSQMKQWLLYSQLS